MDRLIESKSLFCTQTILVMQILIRTSSAILSSKVLTVSSFLILKVLVVVDAENNKPFLVLARMWVFDEVDNSKQSITPSTKWDQVKEILGDCGRAAIQTQGSTSNPFGSTFVYGYQNIAFEVMKNGYIATVTLFQS
ncbi:hypothetical protein POTOM_021221 [Populus tomentosa]|uniref:Uncharacterized protein n=1 Tax=Populus tomentosa TaxID=118781 RepID=A0A8X7ZTG7_POPTO|nr:hypothetical protein POTOM_021221 [Populus tomentosa]